MVLSLGGSVLLRGDEDVRYLRELSKTLMEVGEHHPLAVVVGGGRTAREYIQLGRELGLPESDLDELGIDVTRLHAHVLALLLGTAAPPRPLLTVTEAAHEVGRWPVVVMGGTEPGHSTDAVAAVLAERIRAERMVNATRTPGLFDKDPEKFPDAKRIPLLDMGEFRRRVFEGTRDGVAGQSFPFDRLGVDRLFRAKIPLAILNGRNLPQLRAALEGKAFEGTLVQAPRG